MVSTQDACHFPPPLVRASETLSTLVAKASFVKTRTPQLSVYHINEVSKVSTRSHYYRYQKTMSFLRGLFSKGPTTLGVSRSLFFNCKNQVDIPAWYSRGKIASDFRSKQTLLMVHIWLIHCRLLQEGSKGNILQECMFDELWDDTCIRIRSVGINELMVNKRLGEVQAYSFRTCMELDHCMTLQSNDERLEEIAGVMWRSAYLRNNDIMPDHVLELANHVIDEHTSFMDIPSQAIVEGRVEFKGISHLWGGETKKALKDRAVLDVPNATHATADTQDEPLEEGEWRTNLSSDGTVYYYNTKTRETTWHVPEQVKQNQQ